MKISTRWMICITAALLNCEVMASEGPKEPNLIVIMTDEQNLRTIGAYRDQLGEDQAFPWGKGVEVQTPHLDQLAARGALFTNFYAVVPLCTPSRGSFMTGLYPKSNGAWRNHYPLNHDAVTFAEVLREEKGHYTGYFGKWHLDGNLKPGWNNKKRKFGFVENKFRYNRGHWKFIEKTGPDTVNAYEWEDRTRFKGRMYKSYVTDFLFDRVAEFITRQVDKKRHFALMLSLGDPHHPNKVRPPYHTMYKNLTFEVPPTGVAAYTKSPAVPGWSNIPDRVPLHEAKQKIKQMENDPNRQRFFRQYYGMVKLIDDRIGRLMTHLTELDILDNTIIIFTSDHGDLLDEHGKKNKGVPYKTSAGVPFIISYPGHIDEGNIVKTAYSNIDFAPSLLSMMGIQNTNLTTFHGIDGSHEWMNKTVPTNPDQIRYITDSKKGKWAAAFTERYKFVQSKTEPWLYDMELDPDELINFYGNDNYTEIGKMLQDKLYDVIVENDLPVIEENKVLYWSKPACADSDDAIPSWSHRVCADLKEDIYNHACDQWSVRKQCPKSCSGCCMDSTGQLLINLVMKNCTELTAVDCKLERVRTFCPESCNACKMGLLDKKMSGG